MLLAWVVSYLAGVVSAASYATDIYTVIFTLLVYYVVGLYFRSRTFINLKDIPKAKNVFYKMSFMSFIAVLPLCFIAGWLSYRLIYKDVSYLNYTQTPITFEGTIIGREKTVRNQLLTLKVGSLTDTLHNETYLTPPYHLQIPVSMFQEYELYESLTGSAETAGYIDTQVSDKQKLFYRYETENFLIGPVIYVSPYSLKLESAEKELTLREQFYKFLYKTRMSFINVLETYMPEPYSSLASGIVFGETSTLSSETKQLFKNSGLIHLMVLSGSNISFIIACAWLLTRRLSKRGRVVSVLALAWVFVLMTGLTAPAVRAAFMSTLAILAESSGRPKAVIRALVLALGLETLLDPQALVSSASLHLSFLACFGLFVVAPTLSQIFSRKDMSDDSFLKQATLLIIAMTLSTSIYILALSGQVSLTGGLLTLVSEPIVASSTVLAFLIILSSYIFSPLAILFGYINSQLLAIFLKLAEFGANHLPQIYFHLSRTDVTIYYILFITFFSLYYTRHTNNKFTKSSQENIFRYNNLSDKL